MDARDLAAWFLDNLAAGTTGAVDLTDPSGHTTTASLLEAVVRATGDRAELVWVDEDTVLASGAEPWTQLPCWLPERGENQGFMAGDTSRAIATGLVSRTPSPPRGNGCSGPASRRSAATGRCTACPRTSRLPY